LGHKFLLNLSSIYLVHPHPIFVVQLILWNDDFAEYALQDLWNEIFAGKFLDLNSFSFLVSRSSLMGGR
jgi:hypothetical protein